VKLARHPGGDEPELNLVPLIDVVFTLIIFFVVTTSFTERSALRLQLPQANARSEDQASALVLQIDAEGKYYVGSQPVARPGAGPLRDALQQVLGEDRTRPVVLRADARTPHQAVVTAMDVLGRLGVERLSIATTPEAGAAQ
jgi:biopolymer transport protein ExbD